MHWNRFFKYYLSAALLVIFGIGGFILWANPYRNLPFVDATDENIQFYNQRYVYPSIARDPRFNSAVFGTSSIRLLNPEILNETTGAKFAELAMDSATAYEQSRLMEVFLANKSATDVKQIIWGMDVVWCRIEDDYEKITFRGFPEWMYDENPWNDLLYLFDIDSLKIARRVAKYRLGMSDYFDYPPHGYADFLPDESEYDLDKAIKKLYRGKEPHIKEAVKTKRNYEENAIRGWNYATHHMLTDRLDMMADTTEKIFVFVPYHHFNQPAEGHRNEYRWNECKRRVTEIASNYKNAIVIDYMIHSDLTLEDTNYWDPLHYKISVANNISKEIGNFIADKSLKSDNFNILYDYRN